MPQFDLPESELLAYTSSVVVPDDLGEFWTATLAESLKVTWAPTVERVDTGLTIVDTYDVTFAGYDGHPIRAWYRRPANAAADLPVVVGYRGYGTGRDLPHRAGMWPLAGYAAFDMDNRGQGSGGGYVGATADPVGSGPFYPGHLTRGIDDRATYYYRRLFTDAVLAVHAARQLPGVDATRVAVGGGSQGGAIALAVSGLVPDLTAVMADVPFLCDIPRGVAISPSHPYVELALYLATHRDRRRSVFEVLAYFDAVSLVTTATAPALFSVGLMDAVCPPSTVYAAYNAYPGPKQMRVYPYNEHEGGQGFQEAEQLRWLRELMPAP